MGSTRVRFALWHLMIAVAVIACFLVLLGTPRGFLIICVMMLFTHWPLRVAFFASKPALDRLADRVAAGQALRGPVRASLFIVIGAAVDPSSGNVGLIIDPDPSGRSGFVRPGLGPSATPGRVTGPFYNLDFDLELFDGWRYQTED
jgi:hypothetical protein